jgi:hypothetical protein
MDRLSSLNKSFRGFDSVVYSSEPENAEQTDKKYHRPSPRPPPRSRERLREPLNQCEASFEPHSLRLSRVADTSANTKQFSESVPNVFSPRNVSANGHSNRERVTEKVAGKPSTQTSGMLDTTSRRIMSVLSQIS